MTSSALDHAKPGLGGRPPGGPDKPGAGGSGSGPSGAGLFGDTARVGLLAFLGTVSMLFIGFTSAYILRRASADWRPLDAPWMLWLNSLVLAGSSVTLEAARRRLRGWDLPSAQTLTLATGALGGVFVVGQWLAWQQLAAQGVFLATNPHSSFFYLLTGVHIVH